jgi:ABC-2 type transport system permease protein
MTTTAAGAVYDRGYRPYDGPRGGRSAVLRALWKASVRRALGLRRSWRQKLLPWLLLAIVSVPATVQVGVAYLTRDNPRFNIEFITYREYVGVSTALLLFVGITAPDIICPDRRQRVLPLILSRPLTGTGYALAKLGAITTIVFAFGLLPQIVLFLGQMLVSKSGSMAYARANAEALWQVPIAVAALAVYYSTIGVAVSSLTTRRIAAAAIFIGLMLVSGVVAGILGEVHRSGHQQAVVVQQGQGDAPPVVIRGDGPPPVVVGDGPPATVPQPPNGVPRRQYVYIQRDNTLGSIVNLAQVPLHLRDLIFLGHIDPAEDLGGVDGAGAAVIGLYALLVASAVGVTILRYREAA